MQFVAHSSCRQCSREIFNVKIVKISGELPAIRAWNCANPDGGFLLLLNNDVIAGQSGEKSVESWPELCLYNTKKRVKCEQAYKKF